MSLLAPLFLAGILAVSLPILFHLIRRTPQGRQAFSSLMFLSPSPPRITRRSRLSNILLLILRATALALLALAFARPFLRNNATADVTQSQGRRVGILVDTSASMQRGDLWEQATRQVNQIIDSLQPTDEAGLFFFDKQVRPALTFNEWNELDLARRGTMLKARLAEAKPTWAATNLGSAVATVADLLAESEDSKKETGDAIARQLVLVSDLQQGSHADALQGHQWPANVALDVKTVALKTAGNAGLQIIKDNEDAPSAAQPRLRLRVNSQPGSTQEQLTLTWATERGPLQGVEPIRIYVPAGRSQVVRLDWPPAETGVDRLLLNGDESDFDNTLYVVPPRQDQARVVYIGEDSSEDSQGLRFYLERVVSPTPQRSVEVVARSTTQPAADADLTSARLVVVAAPVAEDRIPALRKYIEQGGDVLWVLNDLNSAAALGKLVPSVSMEISEAPVRNYALISRVVLDHPLFAPFADSRFSDFTKIHFWKHRRVKLADPAAMNVIASFDDGDPFLLEHLLGTGRLLVATSSWRPVDSQLALSTKFVPLIDGLLRRRDGALAEAQYAVGDPIALPPAGDQQRSIKGPDGRQIELPATASAFDGTDRPGVYTLMNKGETTPLAVNLPPDESRTEPLGVEELEQWGAQLGVKPASDQAIARERQLQVMELENRQKLWRWVIVVVLAILFAETLLAGRLARRSLEPQVTT